MRLLLMMEAMRLLVEVAEEMDKEKLSRAIEIMEGLGMDVDYLKDEHYASWLTWMAEKDKPITCPRCGQEVDDYEDDGESGWCNDCESEEVKR